MSAPLEGWLGFAIRPIGGLILFCIGASAVFLAGHSVTQAIVAPLCDEMTALGQEGCQLTFTAPQEAFVLLLRQSMLAGFVLAVPCMIYQLSRFVSPSLFVLAPRKAAIYALAGGVIAIVGVAFVLGYEAPRAVAKAMAYVLASSPGLPLLGLATDYVRAALSMAGSYAALLQIPLLLAMMVKSMRLKRQNQSEV